MSKRKIIPWLDNCQGYRQWWRSAKALPEYGKLVHGIFPDGREILCECSPEDGVWFIDIFTTDPPTWWTYAY